MTTTLTHPATLAELLRPNAHRDFKPRYSKTGLTVERRFTADLDDHDPFKAVAYRRGDVIVSDKRTGAVAFAALGFESPADWNENSRQVAAQKYARKTMVPQYDLDSGELLHDSDGNVLYGSEQSVRQTVARIANAFMFWGQKGGYFRSADDAHAYRDELVFCMLTQRGANNSPVWFNVGLHEAYGIVEDAEGNAYWDPAKGEVVFSTHKYERANVNACYISPLEDDLVGRRGILELNVTEGRLFKGGSGSGVNASKVRGKNEGLTGGGGSSGVMSFLRVHDANAGSIKSGGTTRRAAKMVILDSDHPEVMDFIWAKAQEERKVPHLLQVRDADGKQAYPLDWNAEDGVYAQLAFQNANHSVRIREGFMAALRTNQNVELRARRDTNPDGTTKVTGTVPAAQLWGDIAQAAWECADPGVQFDDLIQPWNTAADEDRINGTNPCSEYVYLDGTACNLASQNLVKFDTEDGFDSDAFVYTTRLWTITLELAVSMSHYPTPDFAERSYRHRTLGLGYANIGALLMRNGLPYDSAEGRAAAGALTALMHSVAYATSSEIAKAVGQAEAYAPNREHVLRVVRNHRRAALGSKGHDAYEDLVVTPQEIDHDLLAATPFAHVSDLVVEWSDEMLTRAEQHGVRNMQVTVLAPTGTIGLLMGCDTTGVEPAFSLLAFKTLAGGGTMMMAVESIAPALTRLGYTDSQVADILRWVGGSRTLNGATPVNAASLTAKGVPADVVSQVEQKLAGAMSLTMTCGAYLLDADTKAALGVPADHAGSFLPFLGFTDEEIVASDLDVCGRQTVEGAPHLSVDHYAVFDTANPGRAGTRSIAWDGHVRFLGATAPFLSGAASKTVNLPGDATVDDIAAAHELAYEQGVKCVAVYRDASKQSQPLSATQTDAAVSTDNPAEMLAAALAALGSDEVALEVLAQHGFGPAGGTPLDPTVAALAEAADDQALRELLASIGEVPEGLSPTGFYSGNAPKKFRMPASRSARIEKITIGTEHEQDVFLTIGEYPDGTVGELFIKMSKEGGTIEGLCSAFATSVSMGLQRGVPLSEYIAKFRDHKFEPAGWVTGHPELKRAESILDAVFRLLDYRYNGNRHAVQNPSDDTDSVAPLAFQPSLVPVSPSPTAPATNGNGAAAHHHGNGPLSVSALAEASPYLDVPCPACGEKTMRQNGSCQVCICGATTGCS